MHGISDAIAKSKQPQPVDEIMLGNKLGNRQSTLSVEPIKKIHFASNQNDTYADDDDEKSINKTN